MTEKYYTPTKEEIYNFPELLLFQDEKIVNGVLVNPFIYRKGETIIDMQKESDFSNIKIKYLDHKDIESLGFDNYIPPMEYNHSWSFKGSKEPKLYAWFNGKVPVIRIYSNFPIIQFQGEVKNKSELKKIMQMIGII